MLKATTLQLLSTACLLLAAAFAPTEVHIADAAVIGESDHAAPVAGPAPSPPWRSRGDRIAADYDAYVRRLGRFHEALLERLKVEAPDLLVQASGAVRGPRASGYQVLPGLLPEKPPPASPPRAAVAAYSWPWTKTLLDAEAARLGPLEGDLERASSLAAGPRRALYERLVAGDKALAGGRALVDSHIQYNRLWQESIASAPDVYDRETQLLKAVLERQTIADALAATDAPERMLRAREEDLARQIHDATDAVTPLPCVRLAHPSAHRWIVHVPFVTDIEDRAFLRAFRSAIETTWHVADGEDDYRLAVSITRVRPSRLYRETGTPPPRDGDPVDMARHLKLFPDGFAVLTTGAAVMHVTASRCVVLGSADIAPHDLAHEVGHMLGFEDVYFRGYRDLGADGYEVQEVIADPGDIMGSPGSGPVRKGQFERLVAALRARSPESSSRAPSRHGVDASAPAAR